MSKYQDFLNSYNVIREEEFNRIIDTFPNVKNFDYSGDMFGLVDSHSLAENIVYNELSEIVNDFELEEFDFEEKSFHVIVDEGIDVNTIKERFPGFKVSVSFYG